MSRYVPLVAALLVLAGIGRAAAWVPAPGDPFDVQLTTPFQLERRVATVVLGLEETTPSLIQQLKARDAHAVCLINAGVWENWRADSGAFDQRLVGANFAGWPGERWLDIRALDTLGPILARRLDQCQAKGFEGVLFRNVDGYANRTGFPLTAKDQLAFNRWLADEARNRGLAVGMMNALELAPELIADVDFVVSESCFQDAGCAPLTDYRKADKAAFAIEYTNVPRKMDAYCAAAAALDVQLIFKTLSLNGKIHRRCP